ncbi:dynein regulatory complex protein 9 [Eurosta solidaginis]|uniref:dynein regulatory complex protein 9 n=1 Tax=Eurosta solidaginis TaxID=178769 RepID=UPI003530B43D
MKHISQLENFEFPLLDLKTLRKALLSAVYAETLTKLSIFQRAQVINSTRSLPKKPAVKSQRSSHQSSRRTSKKLATKITDEAENMLDEKVLDEIRLDQELSLLRNIYAEALLDLNETDELDLECDDKKKTHARLYVAIEIHKDNKNEVEQALRTLNANQATLNALKTDLEKQREAGEEQLAEQDEHIATLRHNLSNVNLLNKLELRLVQRWEENRFTQASIIGSNEERSLQQKIDDFRRGIANEEIIITQIDKFSEKQFADLYGRIAEWQEKYANEMEKCCAEKREKERQMLVLQKSLERHRETYAKRQQFVSSYLAEKEVERQLYEQQIYRVSCAVRLQAWWRGLMVRRGLGPFKKKAKKCRKGKNKGK